MSDDEYGDGREVEGIISDKPFKSKPFRKTPFKKSKCTKIQCQSEDGDYIEVEIYIRNGQVTKCKQA